MLFSHRWAQLTLCRLGLTLAHHSHPLKKPHLPHRPFTASYERGDTLAAVSLSNQLFQLVMGGGSSTVSTIESETDTVIEIRNRKLEIRGVTGSTTATALERLTQHLERLERNVRYLMVPSTHFSLLVGEGATVIQSLQEKHAVTIVWGLEEVVDGAVEITLSGESALHVNEAHKALDARLSLIKANTQRVVVPGNLTHQLFGAKGAALATLREAHGVMVHTQMSPHKNSLWHPATLLVFGEQPERVTAAVDALKLRVTNFQGEAKTTDFPASHRRFVHGYKRRTLAAIESQTGADLLVHLEVDFEGNQYLSAHHPDVNVVNRALAMVRRVVSAIACKSTYEDVDQMLAPALLEVCRALGDMHPSVTITLTMPDVDSTLTRVARLGLFGEHPAEVTLAREAVTRAINHLATLHRTFPLLKAMVHPLRGLNGVFLREFCERHGVAVFFNRIGTAKGQQTVVITPPTEVIVASNTVEFDPESLDRAQVELEARVRALKAACQPLLVPAGFIPFLIGTKGTRIQRLQTATGTLISMSEAAKDSQGRHAMVIFGVDPLAVQTAFARVSLFLNGYYQRER